LKATKQGLINKTRKHMTERPKPPATAQDSTQTKQQRSALQLSPSSSEVSSWGADRTGFLGQHFVSTGEQNIASFQDLALHRINLPNKK